MIDSTSTTRQAPPDKPSWNDAPAWAMGLGVATWDCDYQGQWCWMSSAGSRYFDFVEERQGSDGDPSGAPALRPCLEVYSASDGALIGVAASRQQLIDLIGVAPVSRCDDGHWTGPDPKGERSLDDLDEVATGMVAGLVIKMRLLAVQRA